MKIRLISLKPKFGLSVLLLSLLFKTLGAQQFDPADMMGGCVASFDVMLMRIKDPSSRRALSESREKVYASAINKIKIPKAELEREILKYQTGFMRELNQSNTGKAMEASDAIWKNINFCSKEFAK